MKAHRSSKTGKGTLNQELNAARGRRYTVDEKTTIIGMVHQVNAERGRGGITAASRKFGVSPLTISHWMRDAGIESPRSTRRVEVSHPELFRRLADFQEQITLKRAELAQLESEFNRLKALL